MLAPATALPCDTPAMKRLTRPDDWSLHPQTRLLVCAVIGLLSLVMGEVLAERGSRQIRQDEGTRQLQVARDMADRLSKEMSARARDVLLLSQLDIVRNANDAAGVRPALEKLKSSLPHDAWIGMTDDQGKVVAATGDILLGQSIASQPVFQNGRQALWTGDVHEAVMLSKLVPHKPGEAIKFVDVAAPVRNDAGELRGVLAMRLGWQWAEHLRQATLRLRGTSESLELMVAGRDGKLLLGPEGNGPGVALPTDRLEALTEQFGIERWSDGLDAITSVAESRPMGDFHGLGWQVVARDTQAAARADVAQGRREVLPWSVGLGGLAVLVAWWALGLLLSPAERLATSLRQRGAARGPNEPRLKRRTDVQQSATTVARPQPSLPSQDEAVLAPEKKAPHDPLTGVHNRNDLAAVTEQLTRALGSRSVEFCVLCLDLDGFKPINDRYGREAGDQVLVQVAKRLRQIAREDDLVFRLGSDEFMLLLNCQVGEGLALSRKVAARVLADMRRPLSYRTLSNLHIGCSVGGALWAGTGHSLAEAMRQADEALCAAKHSGRGKFRQYNGAADRERPAPTTEPQAG